MVKIISSTNNQIRKRFEPGFYYAEAQLSGGASLGPMFRTFQNELGRSGSMRLVAGPGILNSMDILQLDHVVLTVRSIPMTVAFYEKVLGLRHVLFDGHYHALHFGSQKINLHPEGNEYDPHAHTPVSGSGDLCFIALGRIEDVITELRLQGVEMEHGPVPQTCAAGEMMSVYFRDPDKNLVEVACRV